MQVNKVSRIGHAVKIAYGACILWFALLIGYAFADDVAEDAARAAVLEYGDFVWQPELAPTGTTVIVVSLAEQRANVYRNGIRIAVAKVSSGRPGYETPTKQWLSVPLSDARDKPAWDIEAVMVAGQLGVNPEFARHVYDALVPGSTVLITDQAFHLDEPTISRMILEANAVPTQQVKPPARR